ncbi:MAG: LysE family transporter [Myxococcota bacterium]
MGSVPIAGPISALVFRSGITGRYGRGRAIAIGGAIGEGMYAFLAFWGVGAVLTGYPWVLPISKALAGVILIALGLMFVRRPSSSTKADTEEAPESADAPKRGLKRSALLGFGVTALNPTLIATWTAVTATTLSSGLASYSIAAAGVFAASAATGIALWFIIFLALLQRFRDRIHRSTLNKLVQGIGVMIAAIGVWFLVSVALAMRATQ